MSRRLVSIVAIVAALLSGLLPRYGLEGVVLAHAARYSLLLAACAGAYWWPRRN